MKQCSHCHQLKDESEFYPMKHTRDHLASWCKACQREANAAAKRRIGETTEPSTMLVARELALRGIPSAPGYGFGKPHVDLIAWGCVPIEAKTSKPANRKDGMFLWHYSISQKTNWFEGIIVFIAVYHDGCNRIFIIPAYHEMLRYKNDGSLRDSIYVNLIEGHLRKNADYELTNLFLTHENAFDEIETQRIIMSRAIQDQARQQEQVSNDDESS